MNRKERRQQAKSAGHKAAGGIEAMLAAAVRTHQAGRLGEAEAIYRQVLAARPGQPDALHFLGVIAYQTGRHDDAVTLIRQAIDANPRDPGYHANLGNALNARGDTGAAIAAYRRATDIMPGFADAHYNLGNVLKSGGGLDDAAAAFRRAIDAAPDFAEAHYNLATVYQTQGRSDEAAAAYRRAIAVKPDYAEAHNNLGSVLLAAGMRDDARTEFERALEIRPDYAEASFNLGTTLVRTGKPREALTHLRRAMETSPERMQYRHAYAETLARFVPAWHFPMMHDARRNDAFRRAIEKAVRPGMHVVEIGAGSGLLAMMAARAGAGRVTTCETVPEIAETARTVIAANGYGETVRLLAKPSTEVVVGADMDAPGDLLIAEIISDALVGEGVLESLEHARRVLVKPDAQIIPRGGAAMAALVGEDDLGRFVSVGEVSGFDLSPFNDLAPMRVSLAEGSFEVEYLSRPRQVFACDFMSDAATGDAPEAIDFDVIAPGVCVGLVQWIRLIVDDEIVIENQPGVSEAGSHWRVSLYRLPAPVAVEPGDTLRLAVERTAADSLYFRVLAAGESP